MKKAIKYILLLLAAILLLCVLGIGLLTATEYRPADTEAVEVAGTADNALSPGDSLRVTTWNTGYCSLGETADFFMDGGSSVKSADETMTKLNLQAIESELEEQAPDVIFLQEVDRDSSRSNHVDQVSALRKALPGYQSSFANNFKVLFMPYPVPPMGKVDSGILSFSRFGISEAARLQLPCPFKWPVRAVNLKRCLLVNRVPLKGTDKELVLVNLHLEAYDNGEGKVAQTRMLKQVLEQEAEAGNYVIAGGDFNQSFNNVDAPSIAEGLWAPGVIDVAEFDRGLQCLMDDSAMTCRSLDQPLAGADRDDFQYYVIDGFILSGNIQVDALKTKDLEFKNSDHNPVIADVTLLP